MKSAASCSNVNLGARRATGPVCSSSAIRCLARAIAWARSSVSQDSRIRRPLMVASMCQVRPRFRRGAFPPLPGLRLPPAAMLGQVVSYEPLDELRGGGAFVECDAEQGRTGLLVKVDAKPGRPLGSVRFTPSPGHVVPLLWHYSTTVSYQTSRRLIWRLSWLGESLPEESPRISHVFSRDPALGISGPWLRRDLGRMTGIFSVSFRPNAVRGATRRARFRGINRNRKRSSGIV